MTAKEASQSRQKTALITGSGRNIGKAIALALAAEGIDIILNGSTDQAALENVAYQIRDMGRDATIAMADIGDRSALDAMISQIKDDIGDVDILVNNAAIRPKANFLDMAEADWDQVMNVDYQAAVLLSRAFLPDMIKHQWGRVINFSGMNSQRGYAGASAVAVAKHAVWGLTKALATEFAGDGITVNIIAPGIFPPEDMSAAMAASFTAQAKANPTGTLGQHDDIAGMVSYLVSDKGRYVNGQMLQINGGAVNQF